MGIHCRFMILSSFNDFLEMRIALCFMARPYSHGTSAPSRADVRPVAWHNVFEISFHVENSQISDLRISDAGRDAKLNCRELLSFKALYPFMPDGYAVAKPYPHAVRQ